MFLSTNLLWKICMKYLHVSLLCGWMIVAPSAQFGEAFSYKTRKNSKYLCQKYFTQLFGTTKTFMLFKNKCIYKKISMTCMLTLDFHANKLFGRALKDWVGINLVPRLFLRGRKDPGRSWSRATQILGGKLKKHLGRGGRVLRLENYNLCA